MSEAELVSDAAVDVDELGLLSGVPMGHKVVRATADAIFALLMVRRKEFSSSIEMMKIEVQHHILSLSLAKKSRARNSHCTTT
jgi:hypothetical protein